LYKLLNKIQNKIQNTTTIAESVEQKYNPIAVLDSLKINKLLKKHYLNVFTKNNDIDIEIWDAKEEDGGIIKRYQNETVLLENYTISNRKKKISLCYRKGKTFLLSKQ
jgi:hypothetical protein